MLYDLLNQACIYWKYLGSDREGNDNYDNPIVLPCRWSQSTSEQLDPDGVTYVSTLSFLTESKIVLGSLMVAGDKIPTKLPYENKVRSLQVGSDMEDDETLYQAML